ncbi:hypothetical protein ACO1ZG_24680, partial [Enterobacter kobei]
KNSLNRLIRCVCGKKIGPDPRNFNQRVSLGRNDLLIRTFLSSELRGQLLGHVRGKTETEVRYSKDLKPVHMVEVVEKIDFSLPEIARFNIPDGLDAVRDALRRKRGKQTG